MKSTETKDIVIHVPCRKGSLLEQCVAKVNANKRLYTLWKVINVNAIDRLAMSDHGPVHFQIVANIALRLARILQKNEIKLSAVANFDLTNDHAELVVFLASIMHDLGMTISREGHEEFSLILANDLLYDILDFLPIEEATIVASETLHAIIAHRKNGVPYTIEAGILRIADALDMSEGRSRIPYEAGTVNIHAISAAAINKIEIKEGKKKPVEIFIQMNNSAGIFQVDELLKSKLKGSGLEKYIQVKASVAKGAERNLIKNFVI